MDRLQSMAVFVEVVDSGGFSAAARRLGLSPTMVGKHLRGLEERLRVRLLQRSTRSQRLTEAGELYLARCRTLLRDIADAEEAASTVSGEPAGLLRITAPISFGVEQLSPALARFAARHPALEFDVSLADRLADPIGDGFDVVFRVGALADSTLIARRLSDYRMMVCAAPAYLDRRGRPSQPADLLEHECLGLMQWGANYPWAFQSPAGRIEIPVRCRIRMDSGPALREAAIAGAGVILQPAVLLQQAVAAGRLEPLLAGHMPPPRPMHLLYPPDRTPTAKLKAFVDFAMSEFRS